MEPSNFEDLCRGPLPKIRPRLGKEKKNVFDAMCHEDIMSLSCSQDCFMFPRTNWKHLKTKFREKWDCWVYSLPVPRVPSTLWKWLLLMLSGSSQLTKLGRLPTASISISHDHLKKMWFHHIYGCSIYFTWSPKNGDILHLLIFYHGFSSSSCHIFWSIYNPPLPSAGSHGSHLGLAEPFWAFWSMDWSPNCDLGNQQGVFSLGSQASFHMGDVPHLC